MKYLTIFLPFLIQLTAARPDVLYEQNIAYGKAFCQGAYVGFQSLLAFMGYYESEAIKEGRASGELIIDAEEDVNDQTQIKVVGLGLGRTGSTSLAVALEMLGYYAVHDDDQVELTDIFYAWEEETIDSDEFHEILGLRGYNASFKTEYEWVQSHEEVKAILTVRDTPEKYVESWSVAAAFIDIVEQIPFRWMPTVVELRESLLDEYKEESTGGNPDDYMNPEVLKRAYLEHNEEIQGAIPSERLLTFNVKQGWAPICEFLEVQESDCPTVPFPHVHTRARLEGEHFFLRMITFIWPLAVILPLYCLMKFGKTVIEVLQKKHKCD
eukprot:CAMPEP_0201724050 /NCGR_PEP_ID=MMETSP0593-20130828/7901_1 /ASSEMBLY_ACC=CAM_ASM_000672 /TAXON_ID=267983 /ORGANISM="Skeletonema japonicum, Strain CCMP2506" /LENGTH=324 /DNA_ID=CAMNT_0048215241 /DNA_START=157 /DNA_END=1131 /DNA_ORIENTATION=-